MQDTTIIAIVGCVTGSISLLISLINVFGQRHRLKVKIDREACYIFDKPKDMATYKTKYQACLAFDLINKSRFPLTVNNIYTLYRISKFRFKFMPILSNDIETLKFRIKSEITSSQNDVSVINFSDTHINFKNKRATRIRLDIFDSESLNLFIHFISDYKPKYLIVKFATARRKKYKIVKLQPLSYIECKIDNRQHSDDESN